MGQSSTRPTCRSAPPSLEEPFINTQVSATGGTQLVMGGFEFTTLDIPPGKDVVKTQWPVGYVLVKDLTPEQKEQIQVIRSK